MANHILKCCPQHFCAILDGTKNFEIRQNDRNYQVGDVLTLLEYNPLLEFYTGHSLERRVTYLVQGEFGLPNDVCVMSLQALWHSYGE